MVCWNDGLTWYSLCVDRCRKPVGFSAPTFDPASIEMLLKRWVTGGPPPISGSMGLSAGRGRDLPGHPGLRKLDLKSIAHAGGKRYNCFSRVIPVAMYRG